MSLKVPGRLIERARMSKMGRRRRRRRRRILIQTIPLIRRRQACSIGSGDWRQQENDKRKKSSASR
eukprot:764047-Hanusia_phi.AAC.1